MKQQTKTLLVWLGLIVAVLALANLFNTQADIAQAITGTARLRLYKGSVTTLGRKAPRSLYRPDIVTFEEDSVYDQRDSQGFIKLQALRLRIRSELDKGGK